MRSEEDRRSNAFRVFHRISVKDRLGEGRGGADVYPVDGDGAFERNIAPAEFDFFRERREDCFRFRAAFTGGSVEVKNKTFVRITPGEGCFGCVLSIVFPQNRKHFSLKSDREFQKNRSEHGNYRNHQNGTIPTGLYA